MFKKKEEQYEGLSKRPIGQEIDLPPVVTVNKLSKKLTPKGKKDIAPNS